MKEVLFLVTSILLLIHFARAVDIVLDPVQNDDDLDAARKGGLRSLCVNIPQCTCKGKTDEADCHCFKSPSSDSKVFFCCFTFEDILITF